MGRKRCDASHSRRPELPDGVLANTTYMEIDGTTRAVIAGCKGIYTYSEDCVALRTMSGLVSVYGRDLEMGCLTADGATVTGRLQRIEFSDGVCEG